VEKLGFVPFTFSFEGFSTNRFLCKTFILYLFPFFDSIFLILPFSRLFKGLLFPPSFLRPFSTSYPSFLLYLQGFGKFSTVSTAPNTITKLLYHYIILSRPFGREQKNNVRGFFYEDYF